MVDLHFTYRDGPTWLCCELDDLKEDEIAVVLEALKQRFDTVEQGAFSFSIKEEKNYSPLQLTLRRRDYGEWMDSGFENEIMPFAGLIMPNANCDYTDEQQRWMNVRHTAQDFNREINQLREDSQSSSSIIKRFSRDELLDRLAKIAPGLKIKKQREEVAEEAQVGGEKESNAVEGEGKEVGKARKGLPNIRKHDKQAHQMSLLHNMTQEMIAEKLNRGYGATYTQGQVSRMISRMKEHVEASGLSEHMPASSGPIQSLDPTVIEMGERKSQLTPRQRDMRDPDSD